MDTIILLRAVNVGGRQLAMAELRACLAEAGFADVRSYIASGNLLVTGEPDEAAAEARVEAAVEARFGLKVEAIARSARHWRALIAANPMTEAARARPKMLHLAVGKRALPADAAAQLQGRAQAGEVVAQAGGALWIDFADGVGRSKLTPDAINRAAGSPVTTRNWNSVLKLAELAGAGD